jgi:hypothetical protein
MLTSAPWSGRLAATSVAEATRDRSPGWGKFSHFPCTIAESTFRTLMDVDFAAPSGKGCLIMRKT